LVVVLRLSIGCRLSGWRRSAHLGDWSVWDPTLVPYWFFDDPPPLTAFMGLLFRQMTLEAPQCSRNIHSNYLGER
ncbi:MAG: hypothetical protein ACP5O0_11005, partial [Acidimicrobiales bacterium]